MGVSALRVGPDGARPPGSNGVADRHCPRRFRYVVVGSDIAGAALPKAVHTFRKCQNMTQLTNNLGAEAVYSILPSIPLARNETGVAGRPLAAPRTDLLGERCQGRNQRPQGAAAGEATSFAAGVSSAADTVPPSGTNSGS